MINVPAQRDLQVLKLSNSLISDSCGENVMPATVRTVQGSVQANRQDHSQMVTLNYSHFNKFVSAAAALKVILVKSSYQHFCNFCVHFCTVFVVLLKSQCSEKRGKNRRKNNNNINKTSASFKLVWSPFRCLFGGSFFDRGRVVVAVVGGGGGGVLLRDRREELDRRGLLGLGLLEAGVW